MAPLLAGSACEKKQPDTAAAGAIVGALDKNGSGEAATGPTDTTPLTGIDASKLDAKKQEIFYKLADSLTSPCGKAHSLRTSVNTDTSCKRAPFAARYVLEMVALDAAESDARRLYADKYAPTDTTVHNFKLDGVPHHGATDAPVTIVEFFDYGCPVCVQFKPELDKVFAEIGKDLVVYYKMSPIVSKHPDSMSAAQAAIAAQAQGKFQPMHDYLFANPGHKKADVMVAAKAQGLDMATFEADYTAAEPKIRADMAEGDANGVKGTPTLFFNGRLYEGPLMAKLLAMWVAEEVAVSR